MWRTNENVHAFRNIHAMYAFEYWQHDYQYEYYLNVLFPLALNLCGQMQRNDVIKNRLNCLIGV